MNIFIILSIILISCITALIFVLSKNNTKDNYDVLSSCKEKQSDYLNQDLKLVSNGNVFQNGGISFNGYNYYVGRGKGKLPVPQKNKQTFYVVSLNKPAVDIFAISDLTSDFSKMVRGIMPNMIVFTDGTGKGTLFPTTNNVENSWNDLLKNYNNGTELYLYSLNNDSKSNLLIGATYGCAYIDNGGENSFPCGTWKYNYQNNQPCLDNSGDSIDCSTVLNECCKNICRDYENLKPDDSCEDNN